MSKRRAVSIQTRERIMMVIGRGDSYRMELKCVVPDLGFSLESRF